MERRPSRLEPGEIDIVEIEVAVVLLEDSRRDRASGSRPSARARNASSQPSGRLSRDSRSTRPAACSTAVAEMPGGHRVGEEVVVDTDVVLVGPDHIAQVCPSLPIDLRPVLPVAGPVEGHLRPPSGEELLIIGPSQVVVDGIGDVGDDVLFDLAGADPDPLPIGGLAPVRGHLVSGAGRLPGEESAGLPVAGGLSPRPVETPIPVAEMGPSQIGLRHREIRHHEDVGVPEDVMPVAVPGEEAGPHSRPLRGPGRPADELESGETKGLLGERVAGDLDLARLPAPRPLGGRGGGDLIEVASRYLCGCRSDVPLEDGVLDEPEPLPRREVESGGETGTAGVVGETQRSEATDNTGGVDRGFPVVGFGAHVEPVGTGSLPVEAAPRRPEGPGDRPVETGLDPNLDVIGEGGDLHLHGGQLRDGQGEKTAELGPDDSRARSPPHDPTGDDSRPEIEAPLVSERDPVVEAKAHPVDGDGDPGPVGQRGEVR